MDKEQGVQVRILGWQWLCCVKSSLKDKIYSSWTHWEQKAKKLKVLDSCPRFLLLNQSSDHQPVFPAAGNLHHSTKPSNSALSLFFCILSLFFLLLCLYWKWIKSLKLKLLKVNSLNDWTAKLTDWDTDHEQLCYEHFSSHYWSPNLPIVSSQYISFSTFSTEHSF